MMKTKSLLFFLFLQLSLTAVAQQDTLANKDIWTLKQCIDYALSNSLSVQRSSYNVETSEVDYLQSKMSLLPSLNAGLNFGYSWGRSVNPVTNLFVTQEINSLSPGVSSSVTLFNGLRLQSMVKQGSRNYQASVEDLQKAKNDVSLNIAFLYINVIFSKEQYENARLQLSSSQQQFERTKKQVAVGALPRSNELNLDAQVATNELNLITRENTLALSLLQLKQALQLPASTPFDVEAPEIDVEDLVLDQTRNEIYDIARATMPEIKSAALRIESADFAVKAARGNLYPRLSLSGGVNSNYSSVSDRERFISDGGEPTVVLPQIGVVEGTGAAVYSVDPISVPSGYTVDGYGRSDQLQDNIFRQLTFGLTIPIFNGYQSKAAYQRSVINRQVAAISAKEVDNTLRQNVETAYNDALAASKTYNSSLRQVSAREEAYRMTKQRFDIGAVPYVEYQVAENDLFQAKSDLVRAKYDFILKKKVLDFYQGKPLEY
jgi:outer membrane protein